MLSDFVCFALGSTSSTSSTNINNSSPTTSSAATTACKFFIRILLKNFENLLKKQVLMMNRFPIEDHQSCVCQVIGFYLKVNGYINFESEFSVVVLNQMDNRDQICIFSLPLFER
jgi:hypothetical protein